MKKLAKIFAFVLIIGMTLSLVACGGDKAAKEPVTDEDGKEWLKGKTITIIVPFKAGGSLDLMVRALVPYWEEVADCTFVVENREGAATQIGTTYFFSQKQDGSVLYCGTQTFLSAAIAVQGAKYDIDDFALINMQQIDPTTMTVLKSSPYQTIDDLIKAIEDNPGEIKCGMVSGGAGAVMLQILKDNLGLDIKIVTYDSGNDMRTALLGGHVDFIPGSANGDMGLGDEAHPLVVCGHERNKIWPDTPCTDEIWPDYKIPASLGSCRLFSVSKEMKEMYPKRFEALVETYKEAFENPEYQKYLEDKGELYVSGYLGPEESDEVNNALHDLIMKYKDALTSN